MQTLYDTPVAPLTSTIAIGDYLIQRLQELGAEHVFGVPGDFVLGFMTRLEASPLRLINTCDEQGAGFAADAYARMRGLGVVCVTYGVGGLKIANTTGQAYAERSPVVVISGAPSRAEQATVPLLHHKVRGYNTQRLVFEQLTGATAVLDDPETACREIDRVLAVAMRHKLPVYIELPRDMVKTEGLLPAARRDRWTADEQPTDENVLNAALEETIERLRAARQPVAMLGVETHRFDLLDQAVRFVEQAGLPTVVTLLDKSAISEHHPNFIGVYGGQMGRDEVRAYVESSDCVLLLGVMLTDLSLGGFTAKLDPARLIHANSERLTVGYHTYEGVRLADVVNGLVNADVPQRDLTDVPKPPAVETAPSANPDEPLTVERLFARLAAHLSEDTVVIADPGDALFAASELPVYQTNDFLAPAYYASLGFAVPAAIGAQLAAPERRPLVLVGDGAFQMTGVELATAIRFNLSPVVIVLNNAGYTTERYILDGAFNDVLSWAYHKLPEVFGAGRGHRVTTEREVDAALADAAAHPDEVILIEAMLDKMDASPALRRLAARLR